MENKGALRGRHDGWTPGRQLRFLTRLSETGCVQDACDEVGMSTTNAYRTYKRLPDFASRWDAALASPRPVLAQAAFDRAVHGVEVAVHRNGKVVATHRRYSDGLLRFLIERGDRAAERSGQAWRKPKTLEEVQDSIITKLTAIEDVRAREDEEEKARERAEAVAFAERMRAEGKAP
ncbi:hypothetical protein [uncultured Sphingomonas sp.]|uniref:hypothetical protein n=1 Tax=uncultured Sphingomonas sp. TaxID=158754 RepID=UPI0035CB6AD3